MGLSWKKVARYSRFFIECMLAMRVAGSSYRLRSSYYFIGHSEDAIYRFIYRLPGSARGRSLRLRVRGVITAEDFICI